MTLSDAEIAAAENTPLTPENRPAAAPPPSSRIQAEGRSLYDELAPIGCLYCRQRQAAAEAAGAPANDPAMTCAPLLVGWWAMPAMVAPDHPGAEPGTVIEVRCSEHDWWFRVDTRGLGGRMSPEAGLLADELMELRSEHNQLTEEHRRLLRAFEETAAANIPGEPVAERRRPDVVGAAPRVANAGPPCGGCFGGGRPPPPSPRCPPPPKPAWAWVEELVRDAVASGALAKGTEFLGKAIGRHMTLQEEQKRFGRKAKRIARSRQAIVERLRGVIEAMGIGESAYAAAPSFVPVAASTLAALRDIADTLDDLDVDEDNVHTDNARYATAYASAEANELLDLLRATAKDAGIAPETAAPSPENAAKEPQTDAPAETTKTRVVFRNMPDGAEPTGAWTWSWMDYAGSAATSFADVRKALAEFGIRHGIAEIEVVAQGEASGTIASEDASVAGSAGILCPMDWKPRAGAFAEGVVFPSVTFTNGLTRRYLGTMTHTPQQDASATPSATPTPPVAPAADPIVNPYDHALVALKALDATALDKVSRLIPSIRKVALPPRITERYVVRHLVTDDVVDKVAGETAGFDSFVDALAHVRTIYPDAVTQPVPRAQLEERGPVPIPVSHVWRSSQHLGEEPDDPIIAINGPIPVVVQ